MDLAELLAYVFKTGASDLHLTVGLPPMVRIDGQLHAVDGWPRLMPDHVRALAYEFLTQRQIDDLVARREISTSHYVQGAGRLRISIYHQRGSLGIAMRVIDASPPTLADIGMPDTVRKLAMVEQGLVLAAGPRGSGVSTTLAAMVQHINERRHCHVLTVEDPIEFLFRHQNALVEQRQLGDDVYSYAQALRGLAQQDVDVVLVADLPDVAAVEAALELADGGCLVLASVHAPTTTRALRRLVTAFPLDRQREVSRTLADVLVGAIAQHLLPRTTGHGRVLALELMLANEAVKAHLRAGELDEIPSAIDAASKEGMLTLQASLLRLWRESLIAREHALSRAPDARAMLKAMA